MRFLIFLGLKILEILGITLLMGLLYLIVQCELALIFVTALLSTLFIGLVIFANWIWAGELLNKWRSK